MVNVKWNTDFAIYFFFFPFYVRQAVCPCLHFHTYLYPHLHLQDLRLQVLRLQALLSHQHRQLLLSLCHHHHTMESCSSAWASRFHLSHLQDLTWFLPLMVHHLLLSFLPQLLRHVFRVTAVGAELRLNLWEMPEVIFWPPYVWVSWCHVTKSLI